MVFISRDDVSLLALACAERDWRNAEWRSERLVWREDTPSTPIARAWHGGFSAATMSPGILGADGVIRGRIADVDGFAMFCLDTPLWQHDCTSLGAFGKLAQSVNGKADRAETRQSRVERLAQAYAQLEPSEVSPFDEN